MLKCRVHVDFDEGHVQRRGGGGRTEPGGLEPGSGRQRRGRLRAGRVRPEPRLQRTRAQAGHHRRSRPQERQVRSFRQSSFGARRGVGEEGGVHPADMGHGCGEAIKRASNQALTNQCCFRGLSFDAVQRTTER